jgi:hypothetical protein
MTYLPCDDDDNDNNNNDDNDVTIRIKYFCYETILNILRSFS